MKSRTSFFNLTAFRKDIFRFFPIWGLYTIFLLLVLFAQSHDSDPQMARSMLEFTSAMSWINLIYGGLCGAFLLMDLFNGRLCNALHAFPMRRESWLTTHILAGVLFSLVPNLLLTLLASLLLWEYAYMALLWLAVSTLQYLFFFGSAVLCGVCAGNLIGMGVLYGIFHFITVLVQAVAELLYEPLLHGIQLNTNLFYRYFPAYQLGTANYAEYRVHYSEHLTFGQFEGLVGASWWYVGICAGVGIVLAALAYLVYRRRQLESAGDFISLRPLSPLFLVICTVGAGAIFYMFSELFDSKTYIMLIIGGIIGYFAGSMLLNRTLKVFNKKAFVGLGVVAAVFAGSLLLTSLDPLGVTRYVPNIDNVESAVIWGADKADYNYLAISALHSYVDVGNGQSGYRITDREELEDLQSFHRELTGYRYSRGQGTQCDVRIQYKLKGGRTVTRYYDVGRDSAVGERAGKYFNDMRYIFEINDPIYLYRSIENVEFECYLEDEGRFVMLMEKEDLEGLLDAIKADCEAGLMAQNWAYHRNEDKGSNVIGYLYFSFDHSIFQYTDWGYSSPNLTVWSDSTNTVKYLEEMCAKYPK